jgi:hypothetical protein
LEGCFWLVSGIYQNNLEVLSVLSTTLPFVDHTQLQSKNFLVLFSQARFPLMQAEFSSTGSCVEKMQKKEYGKGKRMRGFKRTQ